MDTHNESADMTLIESTVEVSSTEMTRSASEVQAAVIMAKRFPRDQNACFERIMTASQRFSFAEKATYSYPRGGQTVTGPSIRLAEEVARNWGNVSFGVTEIAAREGESDLLSYCWDLETNVRQSKTFTVKHQMGTRKGIKHLSDPRDIYEHTANQAARRMRACILGVIPADIVEAAVDQCHKTLKGGGGAPLPDRIRSMVAAFRGLGITIPMLEAKVGHDLDSTNEDEVAELIGVFNSVRENLASVDDHFDRQADEFTPSDAMTEDRS